MNPRSNGPIAPVVAGELLEAVQMMAAIYGVSVEDFLRKAVTEYLSACQSKPDFQSRFAAYLERLTGVPAHAPRTPEPEEA